MKLLVPIALALLTVACAPPKPGTVDHQRLLEEQAREHFYALKAQQRKTSGSTASTTSLVPTAPIAATTAFVPTTAPAQPAMSRAAATPRRTDDTLYYYDMPYGPEPPSTRYRALKRQYAWERGKRPETLTAEEREWVRKHYRD